MPAHIDACDALVYPYTHADFSYSVATGLAYGSAPVVASDVYGHREIAGYCPGMTLFRSGDAVALAAALRRALEDEGVRAEAKIGMARYAREYSWPAIAARTREVYAEIVGDLLAAISPRSGDTRKTPRIARGSAGRSTRSGGCR
ncbi:MAG: glycosyltransferase [Anaerolineae bacterium]|nr:glycosyltransferase [Anaerolineae bacterium]